VLVIFNGVGRAGQINCGLKLYDTVLVTEIDGQTAVIYVWAPNAFVMGTDQSDPINSETGS